MSAQAIFRFLEEVSSDDRLRTELAEHVRRAATEEARVSTVAALAERRGFSFAPAEFAAVRAELARIRQGALDEEALSGVAGGVGAPHPAVQAFNALPAHRRTGILGALDGLRRR